MKFGKTTLFFIILAVALLTTIGMNIKEGLAPDRRPHEKEQDLLNQRSGVNNAACNSQSRSNKNMYDKFLSERRGVRRVDIPDHEMPHHEMPNQDMYVLKSTIVPPVCPKCPQQSACPRQKPCPACPPCSRCPEPAFTCKKVPNYNSTNNQHLPLPWSK